jgi:hypothetical protein
MAGSTSKGWALDIQGRVITRCCLDMVMLWCGAMNVSTRDLNRGSGWMKLGTRISITVYHREPWFHSSFIMSLSRVSI